MLSRFGEKFTDLYKRFMPDSFVFAFLLTLVTAIASILFLGTTPIEIITSWYKGFWGLLEFGMQLILILVTGYSIALSPQIDKGINKLSSFVKTPAQVYLTVTVLGVLLSSISWGLIVVVAVLARQLAQKVRGINYPFLIACVYFANNVWVTGLSSSIPLVLNTESNFIIKEGILEQVIPTSYTLGSSLNFSILALYFVFAPLLVLLLIPKKNEGNELNDLVSDKTSIPSKSIIEEASLSISKEKSLSDRLNHSRVLQFLIYLMGLIFIVYYFTINGFDINLNIVIFIFIILGLILHQNPKRYSIAMKRASSNVSGIIFQFPFYAGIMGIMIHTGLGSTFAKWIANYASIEFFPYISFIIGGVVNFAIPSGGGEFAVIGPSLLEAANEIAVGLPLDQVTELISKTSLAIAYGESLTNLLQPFYLLIVLPVMGAGTYIEARDVMGYLVIPFIFFFTAESLLILFLN